MKIIGLLIVKNEADILNQSLDHMAKWMDGVVAICNGGIETADILDSHTIIADWVCMKGCLDESLFVPKLIELAERFNADWYIDNDADEFFDPSLRQALENIEPLYNIATVDIHSELDGRTYDIKKGWRRCYRNKPNLFDYSVLKKLHGGKTPINKKDARILDTGCRVIHKPIRSYLQGMYKYNNYLKIDSEGIQKSYEHIKQLAECLKTGDFTGVQWVS